MLDAEIKPYREVAESWLSRQDVFHGFCDRCWTVTRMQVNVGVWFGDQPNLREGLRCECGLSNRQRLIYSFVSRWLGAHAVSTACILERQTILFHRLCELLPGLKGSEYFGPHLEPGSLHEIDGVPIQHEDFCNLSYTAASMDLFIHSDVLEHVTGYQIALREAFRVLKPGGSMVFTCPFFRMPHTIVRARHEPNGELVHLQPPEYHGDSLRSDGILAYYNYGWDLVDEVRAAGFAAVRVCVDYDIFRGLVSTNFPEDPNSDWEIAKFGNMLPLLIHAEKPEPAASVAPRSPGPRAIASALLRITRRLHRPGR